MMHLFTFPAMATLILAGTLPSMLLAEAPDGKPNILLAVGGDIGWTDLGSFGWEIETP